MQHMVYTTNNLINTVTQYFNMRLQHNKKTGQVYAYFPKSLMEAMNWKGGEEITATVQGKDMILLRKFGKQSPAAKTGEGL